MQKDTRYVVEEERPPRTKPRWWRALWLIVDLAASDHAIVERFNAYGPAERRARCLNRPNVLDCGQSSAADSRVERWAMAS